VRSKACDEILTSIAEAVRAALNSMAKEISRISEERRAISQA
jgi:hypothetical protein